MSILSSLFEIKRGHVPGNDYSAFEEQFTPAAGYTPTEGDVVTVIDSTGAKIQLATATDYTTIAATTVVAAAADVQTNLQLLVDALALKPQLWTVIRGTDATAGEYDGYFAGVASAIIGSYLVATTNFDGGDTFTVGDTVTVVAGVIRQNPLAGKSMQPYGVVIEDNSGTTGELIIVCTPA